MATGKPVRFSRVEMTQVVLPGDCNAYGSAFGGRLLSWVDIAAAVAGHRHAKGNVVTASFDDVHFLEPVSLGDIVVLYASVNATWKSSMEIGVKVLAENPDTGERRHTVTAYVTFVAVDRKMRPRRAPVPRAIAETAEEKRRMKRAAVRRTRRLSLRKERRKAAAKYKARGALDPR